MSDFDFDESPMQVAQKPRFNPVQDVSTAPNQRASAPQTGLKKAQIDRPKKAKLPAPIQACNDCSDLKQAYKQLMEQEKEMKKVLREKQLEVKKQADLLVKTDQIPDTKSSQTKEQIRVLESQIQQAAQRIEAIKVGDPEKEKAIYQQRKLKEKPYLDFLQNTELLKSICEKLEIQRRVDLKRQHLGMLEAKLMNKGKGKFQINKIEIMNIRRSLGASREQIYALKDQRERNFNEIMELQNKLKIEFKADLEELFQGQSYEFRNLDLQFEKEENKDKVALLQVKRPVSPPAPPTLMDHEIPPIDPIIEVQQTPVQADQQLVQNDDQDDDFDEEYQSDNEQVEAKLMASLTK
ncbi:hypothetical protein SS50377_22468 [Spironucleus salmonicida]|uniref:Uncharacterized protein n=1 Tax=Spironucleus salmonicida TaxID=348837 RepID=V6LEB8_9EUKA|nr:hypothetical protein SS50377_22468 [Spironucleus salmonicida]|eukprot:EST42041.1 hypothetical protein SS50377_18348 [Spironucleus salmonicida]